jgi:hypothetical protein
LGGVKRAALFIGEGPNFPPFPGGLKNQCKSLSRGRNKRDQRFPLMAASGGGVAAAGEGHGDRVRAAAGEQVRALLSAPV